MEDCQGVIEENDRLREEVSVKNRELLKISKDRAAHPSELGSLPEGQIETEDGQTGVNQVIMELKNKAHLLSEENQILF